MQKEIAGKEIIGYSRADGVHWYWGDTEVAVINEFRREIEWCNRTFALPDEVVEEIRKRMPNNPGNWIIEARRTRASETQGSVSVFVNGVDTGMHFYDEYKCTPEGWISTTPDEALGKYVIASLWHSLDRWYHYSDRFKDVFYPEWRNITSDNIHTVKESDIIKSVENSIAALKREWNELASKGLLSKQFMETVNKMTNQQFARMYLDIEVDSEKDKETLETAGYLKKSEMKIETNSLGHMFCELTKELDRVSGLDNPESIKQHYLLFSKQAFRDGYLPVRVPGGTVGAVWFDKDYIITKIEIDTDYVIKTYSVELEDVIKNYVGIKLGLLNGHLWKTVGGSEK